MIKNIAVFGATGFFGQPVTKALVEAGFSVSVMSSDVDRDKAVLPDSVQVIEGNWMYHHDLKRFLKTVDAVYFSMSVDLNEQPDDFHAETDGLREVLNACMAVGIKRFAYMSSILQYNQVENENSWWVFRVKKDAVNYVRDSGMPFTIFYPSTFMEFFETTYRKGRTIRLFGRSRFPIYFVSVHDYADLVVKSFRVLGTQDKEYFIQGQDCYSMHEAARIYIKNHGSEKLHLKTMPIWWLAFKSLFNAKWKFIYELSKALNENNETFVSDETLKELGVPKTTLAEFAKKS